MFKHYLITRYNLNFRDWKLDKNGKEIRTKQWLLERATLFGKYCKPSVFKQECQEFEWLVLTDAYGPKLEFDLGITQLRLDSTSWLGGLQHWLKKDCKADYIITTRLDNDDAIHEKTTLEIQACFQKQKNEYLNLSNGWLRHGSKVYRVSHPSNQFLSRVEKNSEPKTVYETTHGSAKRYGPIRQLTTRRYWIRNIHNRNIIRDNLSVADYCGNLYLKGFGQ